jgi:site-specific DNA recombinase
MKRRAILYARVSGDDRDKDSLGLQLEMCRDYAESRRYAVLAELAEDERGVSGARLDAPELNRALAMAEGGEYEVLVCREMDRLSRSLAKQMIVEERLVAAGVKVEYVLAEYDESPEGRLQKLVRASVAEYERLKISERMERGRREAVRRGNVMTGGHPPFGYREVDLDDGRRTLEIQPETAEPARSIFQWYVHGDGKKARLSLRAIARKLESLGILSPADRENAPYGHKRRPPGTWAYGSVRQIITNPTYYGEWVYKGQDGTRIAVPVPALVERETWDAAQKRLADNILTAPRNLRYSYLLRSRLRCGKCGYRMSVRKHRKYFYYRCNAAIRTDLTKQCDARFVRRDKLDPRVWACLVDLFSDPTAVRPAYEELNKQPDVEAQAELAVLNTKIERLEKRLVRLQHLYLDGDLDRPTYRVRRDGIRVELEQWGTRRYALERRARHDDLAVVETLEDFATQTGVRLAAVDDFDERMWFVETLDLQVTVPADRVALVAVHGLTIGAVPCD